MGFGVNSRAFQVPVKSAGDAKKVKGKPKKKRPKVTKPSSQPLPRFEGVKDKIQAVKVKHGFGASKR